MLLYLNQHRQPEEGMSEELDLDLRRFHRSFMISGYALDRTLAQHQR